MACSVNGQMNQLICYPGVLDDAVLPAPDYPLCPQEQFSRKPGNESTTDQALSIKIARRCPRFFCFFEIRVYGPGDKDVNKEIGQCAAILS